MDPPTDDHQPQSSENNEQPLEKLLFFNHHEFLISDFKSNRSISTNEALLVINHFPNHHVARDSATYATTRIVRIPRIYDTNELLDIIPQFSTYIPGSEPAALSTNETNFTPAGIYDDNLFGQTSLTPLVPGHLRLEEFVSIITAINQYLVLAFDPYSLANIVDGCLEVATGTLYSRVFNKYVRDTNSKRKLQELEDYITTLNKTHTTIQFISPRRTAYLSVSITTPGSPVDSY